jgi:hypothetical protein
VLVYKFELASGLGAARGVGDPISDGV